MSELIGLGEWRSLMKPQYPDAACFADEIWSAEERNMVLEYLRQGRPLHHWMGMERCVLGCGQHLSITGCTDGTYYWPESLPHYLTHHAVRLPAEFVAHIRRQSTFPTAAATATNEQTQAGFTWWKRQQGWQPDASSLRHLSQLEIRDYLRRYDREQINHSTVPSPADKVALTRMVAELRELLLPQVG